MVFLYVDKPMNRISMTNSSTRRCLHLFYPSSSFVSHGSLDADSLTQYQLRYCPALSQKPSAQSNLSSQTGPKAKKPNPFANPSHELLIAQFPPNSEQPTHNLILNKYPVISHHFILATTNYKPQTDLLELEDLAATWHLLKAWEMGPKDIISMRGNADSYVKNGQEKRLFAFFNSGEYSGASQGHRHLQFLPIEGMKDQEEQGSGPGEEGRRTAWWPLVDLMGEPGVADNVPFQCFHVRLGDQPAPEELFHMYLGLYHKAVVAVMERRGRQRSPSPKVDVAVNATASEISYNLAMTVNTLALCPRMNEGFNMKAAFDGTEWRKSDPIGRVEVNGTILAGTLMVKNEQEWGYLRENKNQRPLKDLLEAIGVANPECDDDKKREHEHL